DPRTLMLELMLALPFVLALALAILRDAPAKAVAWLAGLAPLLALAVLGWLTPAVMAGEIPRALHEWLPHAGLAFSLRLDGLGWMFSLMVLGIGALVVLYAHYYLGPQEKTRRFFCFLLLVMGAMRGMALSGNLLLTVAY